MPYGKPWGQRTASDNPDDIPNTGVTRYYNFDIARGRLAPDGVEREVILVNGQFPGPHIEANWGDWVEVKVTNSINNTEEGTSIHWHGLLQKETPWFDGVPSIGVRSVCVPHKANLTDHEQQCPIAPGKSFTYRFRADLHGTSW